MGVTYSEIIQSLESKGFFPKTALTLDRMKHAISDLNLSIDPQKIILIGGTNGKGSTAFLLEWLLLKHKKIGLTTSPHLVSTCERIRMNGQAISEEKFVEIYRSVEKVIEARSLTHFETLIFMALKAFVDAELDFFIFEVGLGGAWDATNAIDHSWSALTTIGLDHQGILGETLEEIARTKSGIFRKNAHVFLGKISGNARNVIDEEIQKNEMTFTDVVPIEHGFDGSNYFVGVKNKKYYTGIQGQQFADNLALALTIYEGIEKQTPSLEGVEEIQWPGRMTPIEFEGRKIYFSGDHNVPGLSSLRKTLKPFEGLKKTFIVGIGEKKDLDGILSELKKIKDANFIFTQPEFQGRGKESYPQEKFIRDPIEALRYAVRNSSQEEVMIVTGSLYLIGELYRKLQIDPFK